MSPLWVRWTEKKKKKNTEFTFRSNNLFNIKRVIRLVFLCHSPKLLQNQWIAPVAHVSLFYIEWIHIDFYIMSPIAWKRIHAKYCWNSVTCKLNSNRKSWNAVMCESMRTHSIKIILQIIFDEHFNFMDFFHIYCNCRVFLDSIH